MLRIARISIAFLVVCAGAIAVRAVVGLDGVAGEFVDLVTLVGAMLLLSLSDREFFWASPPRSERSKRRGRATA